VTYFTCSNCDNVILVSSSSPGLIHTGNNRSWVEKCNNYNATAEKHGCTKFSLTTSKISRLPLTESIPYLSLPGQWELWPYSSVWHNFCYGVLCGLIPLFLYCLTVACSICMHSWLCSKTSLLFDYLTFLNAFNDKNATVNVMVYVVYINLLSLTCANFPANIQWACTAKPVWMTLKIFSSLYIASYWCSECVSSSLSYVKGHS